MKHDKIVRCMRAHTHTRTHIYIYVYTYVYIYNNVYKCNQECLSNFPNRRSCRMASHNCPVESHTGWLAPLSSWGSLACLAYHCHSSRRSCHSPCCCMLHYFRSYSFVRFRLGAAHLGTSLRKSCLNLWGTKRQKPSSNTGISQMPAVKG